MTTEQRINPNCILTAGIGECPISVPCRVLGTDEDERIWMIEIPTRNDSGRAPTYARGPRSWDRASLEELIENGVVVVGQFVVPGHWKITDDDYLENADSDIERERRTWRQNRRDKAWNVVEPIVATSTPLKLAMKCSGLRETIVERATDCDVSLPTVYNYLHRFLAFGSVKNSLLPDTDRCGGAGKERVQGVNRLGRPRHIETPRSDSVDFTLSNKDKEHLGFGYALIGPDCTAREAFDLTSGAFWADTEVDQEGMPKVTLWPVDKRPTLNQFTYWGARKAEPEDRAWRIGLGRKSKATTHRGGSSQELTVAVGQLAMLDSTSIDVYLTSRFSRLRVLPPANRTALLEVRSTAYLGFHVGWQAPSPNTAHLAILHGALSPEEKVKFARQFGVESTADQWPSALCRTYLTDNGEMRAAETTAAERQFLFSVSYTKTYDGPGKGDVESLHHHDHLRFDHRIPGTTKGRQRERGETPPAERALWNYYEYMREYIRHVIYFNNFVEVPELAPMAMLAAGIRATRMNIFRWFMGIGHRADIPCDTEQLRAFTLTKWPATIEHNGVYLKSEDGKRKLPFVRYYHDALDEVSGFQKARNSRVVVPTTVRLDPINLSQIWLPGPKQLIQLPNVAREQTKRDSLSVYELEGFLDDAAARVATTQQQSDQESFDRTSRRNGTTQNAQAEQDREIGAGEKKPSKASRTADLRQNAKSEQKDLATAGSQRSGKSEEPKPNPMDQKSDEGASQASRAALRGFLESLT